MDRPSQIFGIITERPGKFLKFSSKEKEKRKAMDRPSQILPREVTKRIMTGPSSRAFGPS